MDLEVLDAAALGRRSGFKRRTVLAHPSRRNFRRIPCPNRLACFALGDWGDDAHEGELLECLEGWVSKVGRLKIAERSGRGPWRAGVARRDPGRYPECYNGATTA